MQILFTKEGYESYLRERERLLKERPLAVNELKKAREMGDLSENGYYKSSRLKLSSVDHRLRELKNILSKAKIIENINTDWVNFGTTVVLKDGDTQKTYKIVGEYETDPFNGKISHKSPLGETLLGKNKGETISFSTPKGQKTYKIVSIFV